MASTDPKPMSIELHAIGQRLEDRIVKHLGVPILGLSHKIEWLEWNSPKNPSPEYPRGISGTIFHDCSEIVFSVDFGHIRVDEALLQDPLQRLETQLKQACDEIEASCENQGSRLDHPFC